MMATAYATIGVVSKRHLVDKEAVLGPVIGILRATGADVRIDEQTIGDIPCVRGLAPIDDVRDLNLLVIVGGDGTILRAMRELQPEGVPVVAINAGSVGFLSEMPLADVADRLPALLSGGGMIEHRSCLSVEVVRNGETIVRSAAVNDVVISQGTISRLLDLQASINGQFLATYHADGLIVASPTGSTAYSLAAGGPVVHPVVSALILTPINPHSFTQKPIVLPGTAQIDVTIISGGASAFENATVGLTIDGQVYHELQADDRIAIRTGMEMHFLRASSDAFYRALRTKLKWGKGLDD